ncbi:aldehyde dehydrogenase family protein [Marinobacterium lutimaris]|uniref:Acyl-CoA reductase n=1 Tax=Marinobacterium lutimaris TaxID=568106 RepID=A0A1H6ALS0_9GAMM|nr:aldehyde dehydrogenase family protein [Marinobacterium lutimaris]SEG48706.1 Acyl-CoA reductase [Marinobacterium lutimaris]
MQNNDNTGRYQALHSIGGEASEGGAEALSINPATGELIGRFPAGGRAEAEAAIAAARHAFDSTLWPKQPRERQLALLRWADALERDLSSLADLLTRTNGKPLQQAKGEMLGAISEIRYYAGLARHNPGHAQEVAPGEVSVMMREPAGVASLIIPWNAPAVLLIRSLAPALAVGCTTVTKSASQTALFTAACMAPLIADAAIPAGVVNLIFETGYEAAELLTTHEDVDVVSFTGSNLVGQKIMAAAAPTMKKLSLELGGKSCCVVMPDADIASVAPKIAAAALIISGQQCTAARRVLVHESRLQEMKQALAAALSEARIGNGLEASTDMGPLIDAESRDRVWGEIEQSFDIADEVVLRGAPISGPQGSAFLSPSLIAHSDDNAPFCQEEIFGPLLVLEPFSNEAHAVQKANNTVYGLSASVWTNQTDTAWRMARALRNGTVWINDHNRLFAEAETGGYRRSGIGRLHGYDALLDFCEVKHIYQNVGVVGLG